MILIHSLSLLIISSLVFAEENESEIISVPIHHHEQVLTRRHLERRRNLSRNDKLKTHSGVLYQGIGTHYIVSVTFMMSIA
jgi:predicted Zn-dependent protease